MSTKSVETEIEELHRLACAAGKTSYKDPATGYTVFTEEFHKKRGKCCGNACRHCPFDYVNVPEERRGFTPRRLSIIVLDCSYVLSARLSVGSGRSRDPFVVVAVDVINEDLLV